VSRVSVWPGGRSAARVEDRAGAALAPSVLLLGGDAAVGCGVAFELARASSSGCALLCLWGSAAPAGPVGPGWTAGAGRRARREAARLQAHGLAARACGRLARVALPEAPAPAAAAAGRITGAAVLPVVVALVGPRVGAFDELLAEADLIVVATPPGSTIGALAALELERGRAPAAACSWTPGPLSRPLLLAGRLGLGGAQPDVGDRLRGLVASAGRGPAPA